AHAKAPPRTRPSSAPVPPTPGPATRRAAKREGAAEKPKKFLLVLWMPRKGSGPPSGRGVRCAVGEPQVSESRRLGSISSGATDSARNYYESLIYICRSPVLRSSLGREG
ncbi:unnamed protein product, partial [Gulo gulo]